MKNNFKELTGITFGRLTVVKRDMTVPMGKGEEARWICICTCGKVIIVRGSNLRRGKTKSCGCYAKELNIKNGDRIAEIGRLQGIKNRKGIERMFTEVFHSTKLNAKARNIDFHLTKEQVMNICSEPCFYCGHQDFRKNNETGENFYLVGIDRVDNEKGYEIDNVVPCCKYCNISKNNRDTTEFQSWIKKLVLHNAEKMIEEEENEM